jgi:hypothetical protein
MATITPAQIRLDSKLDFDALGYPAPADVSDPDSLIKEVGRAVVYVESMTGQDNTQVELADGTRLGTLFEQAVQLRVEQVVTQRQPGFVADQNENAIDISVTGYSQKRIDSKEQKPRDMLNPWPELNDVLMLLLTDEMRAYWIAQGVIMEVYVTPMEHVQDIAWDNPDSTDPFIGGSD